MRLDHLFTKTAFFAANEAARMNPLRLFLSGAIGLILDGVGGEVQRYYLTLHIIPDGLRGTLACIGIGVVIMYWPSLRHALKTLPRWNERTDALIDIVRNSDLSTQEKRQKHREIIELCCAELRRRARNLDL